MWRGRPSLSESILCNLGSRIGSLPYLWLAGNEGMEKGMETIMMGHIETTLRIQVGASDISDPKS